MDTLVAPRPVTGTAEKVAVAGAGSWSAIAAWGAGLVQVALGAGAVMAATPRSAAIMVAGGLLILLGVAALGWGAVTLARGRAVAPRWGVAGSLTGILVAAAALALDPVRVSVFAVSAAVALLIAVALACARSGRNAAAGTARSGLIGLVVAAVLVSGVVTPALAATEAGRHAVPHGEMVEQGHH